MSLAKTQTTEPVLDWQTGLYSYDHIPVPEEYKAAHQIHLGFLPVQARPHWLFASSSDGSNAFGKPVAQTSFHLGWVRISENGDHTRREIPAEFRTPIPLPLRYAETAARQYRQEKLQLLVNSAYRPLMARTMHMVSPALRFHHLLYGPECETVVRAFLRLNTEAGMLGALHRAVLEPSAPARGDFGSFSPLGTREDLVRMSYGGTSVNTLVVDRPFCDTAFTLAFPAMTPELFATVGQILRSRTAEFRSRLWQRGGIYGVGFEVSLSHRIFSWWTNLDHAPLKTCSLLRDVILEADQVTLTRHEPERALAFFPMPAPSRAGNLRDCQDRLWGITAQDRAAILGSRPVQTPAGFWKSLLDSAVFGIAGSHDNIARIHDQIDGMALRPTNKEAEAYAS
jgi:hypothetical protein